MKTAVSLPDDIFLQADQLAARLRVSRSALYRDALAQYLARHDPDELTATMDRAVDAAGTDADPFMAAAAEAALRRVEW